MIPACSVNSELDYGQGSLYTNDCRQGHISLSFSQSCEHSNRQSAEVVAPANDSISRAPTAQETYFISKRSSGTETNEKSEAAAEAFIKRQKTSDNSEMKTTLYVISIENLIT